MVTERRTVRSDTPDLAVTSGWVDEDGRRTHRMRPRRAADDTHLGQCHFLVPRRPVLPLCGNVRRPSCGICATCR